MLIVAIRVTTVWMRMLMVDNGGDGGDGGDDGGDGGDDDEDNDEAMMTITRTRTRQ